MKPLSFFSIFLLISSLLFAVPVMAQEEPLPNPEPPAADESEMPIPEDPAAPPPVQPGYAPAYAPAPYPAQPGYAAPNPPVYSPYPHPGGFVPLVSTRESQPNAVYVELMGKGGLYGLGYDRSILSWLGVGAALSYYSVFDVRAMFICPYFNIYPVAGVKNALLVQAGPEIIYAWDSNFLTEAFGGNALGIGGQVSVGYEYRNGFIFRLLFTNIFGGGGYVPWGGLTFGGSF